MLNITPFKTILGHKVVKTFKLLFKVPQKTFSRELGSQLIG